MSDRWWEEEEWVMMEPSSSLREGHRNRESGRAEAVAMGVMMGMVFFIAAVAGWFIVDSLRELMGWEWIAVAMAGGGAVAGMVRRR